MNKSILLVAFSFFGTSLLFAQTDNTQLPPNRKDKIPACTVFFNSPKVDNATEIENAEANRLEQGDKMMRFGKEMDVQLDFMKMAQVHVQPNGRKIYQLGINCQTAKSINLILSNFHLAQGANLFLTDPNSPDYIGAYTAANNNEAMVLGTELLKRESIIIVLDEPANAENPSHFTISTIVHGFHDLEVLVKGLNTSGNCQYDVNCAIGAGYELQRNSVAMMVSGGGFCTGSLVNNTSGTIIPYFISARHCGINPTNWVFRFRWEAPAGGTVCGAVSGSTNGPENLNVNGAVLKASNATSDFILVRLNSNPNPAWGIYYNGWDNTDSLTATMGIGIHHPDGDIKKISIENNPLAHQTINFQSAQNRTWQIANWDYGVTEPGSSGSPLFNQEKRLIGVLSGGTAACSGTTDNNEPDYYGRFGYGWNNAATASGRLKDWLDSTGTGATIIDGIDPAIGNDPVDASLTTLKGFPNSNCDSIATPQFTILNSGTNNLTEVTVAYGFLGTSLSNYTWTGNLPTYGLATVTLPSITVPTGNSTFQVVVANANGSMDMDLSNNLLQKTLFRTNSEFVARLALNFDCYASETSWEVKDALGNTVYAGGPYEDNTEGLVNFDMCLAYGCYDMIIRDSYGDGLSGCSAGAGGNGSYQLTNLANGVVLAEILEANADFGSQNIQNFCVSDVTSLSEINLANLISVYPNPGRTSFKIQANNVNLTGVKIYSVTGQEILFLALSGTQAEINTSELPSSFYFIKIMTDKGELNQRWIKQ